VSGDDETLVGDRSLLGKAIGGADSRAYLIVIAGPGVGQMFRVGDATVVGRGETADVRIFDDEISRAHARIEVTDAGVRIHDLGSKNGTLVNGSAIRESELSDGDKIQIGTTTILKFSFHDKLDEKFQQRMYDSALKDPLTGVFNRRHFSERLELELAYAMRHGTSLSLVIFDLDHFKRINDTWGHLAGDHVLRSVSAAVAGAIRREDMLARHGGEEFALVLRGTDREHATLLAERVRVIVERLHVEWEGEHLPVTASFGVASVPLEGGSSRTDLLAAADAMLYEAKARGRNRVCAKSE
jgi:diguanylate cyclase (GGDEF)-like protein